MNERTIDVVDLIKDGLLGKIWMIHFNAMFSVASVVASTHNKKFLCMLVGMAFDELFTAALLRISDTTVNSNVLEI